MPAQQHADGVIAEAFGVVAEAIPDFEQRADAVRDYLSQNHETYAPMLTSGSPTEMARALFRAHHEVKMAEANRLNRQQAQTISGASQRPATADPATKDWDSVKNTESSGYVPLASSDNDT